MSIATPSPPPATGSIRSRAAACFGRFEICRGGAKRRDAARTFVAATDRRVYGYYTLLAGQLDHHEATPETSRGLSQHFPIPVAILARLAVDVSQKGLGIGATLLNDALVRVAHASEQVAVCAVVVHAIDKNASAFYERFGFKRSVRCHGR